MARSLSFKQEIIMKLSSKLLITAVSLSLAFAACSKKKEKTGLPSTPPGQVVLRFFDLLAEGGKLTTKEAMKMISDKYTHLDLNIFRKWTQNYSGESKIKVLETIIPKEKNKSGDIVAMVKLEVLTPSMFGGDFKSTSRMNLILDEEANEWKIDFLADTIDEASFLKAPKEARAESATIVKKKANK